ncbi:MAG TPA: EthD family reductase [Candidatus Limnocylindria bacterium]|jgi:uncharacterized protein (TIGR02118 family)|nr:EthD family reductase [Candidatus Limnocylindria bacterium]
MVTLIAMYPTSAPFDRTYYFATHMPLVEAKWKQHGLKKSEVQTVVGTGGAGGPSPYHVVTLLYFEDMAALQNAVASPEGAAVVGDIKNFFGGDPVLLISEPSAAA